MGLVVAVWIGATAGPKPQPPVQATKPSIAETAEPNRERLDLGSVPSASSGESTKETSKPETETAPAEAVKPKTPPTGKSRTGVQPANKTPPKKRIGYEE